MTGARESGLPFLPSSGDARPIPGTSQREMDLEGSLAELAPQLLRYALGRTGERALAEEVSQDALAALVSRWQRHGPPDCPAAFAFAVARRRASRAVFRRRLFAPLETILNRNPEHDDAERMVGSRIELRRTLQALRRLSADDRHALLVAASGEVGLADAARRAGMGPSTLRMRLLRARRRLRAVLKEKT